MTSTNSNDTPESKKNVDDSEKQSQNKNESVGGVKQHLTNVGNQVQDYLDKVDAKIDGFKFTLEKHGEGLTVDLSFRATLHPKNGKTVEKAEKVV